MEIISGDALRGHLETMALSVLERGEAHGFEVLRRLEQAGCGALRLKEGTLYPVLYRLERAGLLRAAWEGEDSDRRGPRRRIYRLTPKGTRALAERRADWNAFVTIIGRIVGAPA
jgi:DNA-binding PadR family transcriptional regulator